MRQGGGQFRQVRQLIRLTGSWSGARGWQRLYSGLMLANAAAAVGAMFADLAARAGEQQLGSFAFQAALAGSALSVLWSLAYLWARRRTIEALLARLEALPLPPELGRAVGRVDRAARALAGAYCLCTVAMAALAMGRRPRQAVFLSRIPPGWTAGPRYWLLAGAQAAAGFCLDVGAAAFTGLYLQLTAVGGARLGALARGLRAGTGCGPAGSAAAHRLQLQILADVKAVLSPLLLGHFLISEIGICCALFSSISCFRMPETSMCLTYMGIVWFYLITQLFIMCIFGNYLTTQAESIRFAAYESGWENDLKSSKSVVFMMVMRASHSLLLTAGGFVPVSLNTMSNILQHSISYLMVMMSLTNTEIPINETLPYV